MNDIDTYDTSSKSAFTKEVNKNLKLLVEGKPFTMPLSVLKTHPKFAKEITVLNRTLRYMAKHPPLTPEEIELRKKLRIEHRKKYNAEYYKRPEVMERLREYYRRPEVIERIKRSRCLPKTKERIKEYRRRPEVKARRSAWSKEYYRRPKVQERLKARQTPEYIKRKRTYHLEYSRRPGMKIKRRVYYYNIAKPRMLKRKEANA